MKNRKWIIIGVVFSALYILMILSIVVLGLYLGQIESIVKGSITNENYKSDQIPDQYVKIIRNQIVDNWEEWIKPHEKIRIKDYYIEEVNILGQYVWVAVHYDIPGLKFEDGEVAENMEYYKCHFKIDGSKIKITRVGVGVLKPGETYYPDNGESTDAYPWATDDPT